MKNTEKTVVTTPSVPVWHMKDVCIYCERVSHDMETNDKLIFFAVTPDGLIRPLFIQRFYIKYVNLFQGGMTLEKLLSRQIWNESPEKIRRIRRRVLGNLRSLELESAAYDESPVSFQLRSPRRPIPVKGAAEADEVRVPEEEINIFAPQAEEEAIWEEWKRKNEQHEIASAA